MCRAGLGMLGPTARTIALSTCWLVVLPIVTIRVSRLFWESPLGHQGLDYDMAAEFDRAASPVFYSPWDGIASGARGARGDAGEDGAPLLVSDVYAALFVSLTNPIAAMDRLEQLRHADDGVGVGMGIEEVAGFANFGLGADPDGLISARSWVLSCFLQLTADCISGTLLCILILLVSFSALALREAIALGDFDQLGLGGGGGGVDPLDGWERALLDMNVPLPAHLIPAALQPPIIAEDPPPVPPAVLPAAAAPAPAPPAQVAGAAGAAGAAAEEGPEGPEGPMHAPVPALPAPPAPAPPVWVEPNILLDPPNGGEGGAGGGAWDDQLIEEMNLPQALGMDQPLFIAVSRIGRLALYNFAFLATLQLLPFHLGSLVLLHAAPPRGNLISAAAVTPTALPAASMAVGYITILLIAASTITIVATLQCLKRIQRQHALRRRLRQTLSDRLAQHRVQATARQVAAGAAAAAARQAAVQAQAARQAAGQAAAVAADAEVETLAGNVAEAPGAGNGAQGSLVESNESSSGSGSWGGRRGGEPSPPAAAPSTPSQFMGSDTGSGGDPGDDVISGRVAEGGEDWYNEGGGSNDQTEDKHSATNPAEVQVGSQADDVVPLDTAAHPDEGADNGGEHRAADAHANDLAANVNQIEHLNLLNNRLFNLNLDGLEILYGLVVVALTWVKVGLFLAIELLVVPECLGWCVDMALIDVFEATMAARLDHLHLYPMQSLALHWIVGIFVMVVITLAASELRRLLHPTVLPDLLPPVYNEDDPLQPPPDARLIDALVHKPIGHHVTKIVVAVAVCVPFVIAAVYLPTTVGHRIFRTIVYPFVRLVLGGLGGDSVGDGSASGGRGPVPTAASAGLKNFADLGLGPLRFGFKEAQAEVGAPQRIPIC